MRVSGLNVAPAVVAAAAPVVTKIGGSFFSKIFGGGDVNYANNFSSMVGIGKMFLQTEADAYYARSNRIGVSAFEIAKMEVNAGRALSDNEVLALAGKAPASAVGYPPAYPEAFPAAFGTRYPSQYARPGSGVSLPLIIGGVAVLAVGAALFIRKK